ncbi:hypothetical protein GOP47_0011655 [Adiantum capillus-veneris]|uniref:Uncharacterized protein n=1 Tax=Adiantum capillus-veneris TaxID=13818 RepID=A0A9D4ZGY9_ADICA|nr:hypothetical protein GOP47_0011655 [Adiantum capillus-veneris]
MMNPLAKKEVNDAWGGANISSITNRGSFQQIHLGWSRARVGEVAPHAIIGEPSAIFKNKEQISHTNASSKPQKRASPAWLGGSLANGHGKLPTMSLPEVVHAILSHCPYLPLSEGAYQELCFSALHQDAWTGNPTITHDAYIVDSTLVNGCASGGTTPLHIAALLAICTLPRGY